MDDQKRARRFIHISRVFL